MFPRTALALLGAGVLMTPATQADQLYHLQVYCEARSNATVIFSHLVKNQHAGTRVMCAGRCQRAGLADIQGGERGMPDIRDGVADIEAVLY